MNEYNFDPMTGKPVKKEDPAAPEATPAATPETTPAEAPEATPAATPEAAPAEAPEATPAATPEAAPAEAPEATPAATPETTPAEASETPPAATPQATPAGAEQTESTYHYVRPEFGETYFRTSAAPSEQAEQPGGAQASAFRQDTSYQEPAQQYTPPQESAGYTGGYGGYYQPSQAPVKKKKESRPLTTKMLVPIVAGVAVLALILGLAGGILGVRYWGDTPVAEGTAVIYKTTKLQDENGDTVEEELTVSQVAALVKNSVVEITTEQIVTGSFMLQYGSEGAGSGVIITTDGYIVTNHHVIEGATNINVRLADGTEYAAKLIASDSKTDLAVIKIEATGLTPAAYGSSSELEVGETVIAVGNPLGQLGGTVTSGIISALDREITIDDTTMQLLQTDTAINPGNSGGGMFNTSGQLVGIVNAKSAGEEIEGLGFAIPIDTAEQVIEDLITNGYVTGRVDPGITFVEINDSMTAMRHRVGELGLYASAVGAGADAANAGLQSGDYVVSIDGTAVTTTAEANAVIDAKNVGDTLTMVVKRNGTETTVTLTLSEYVPSVSSVSQTQSQNSANGGNIIGF